MVSPLLFIDLSSVLNANGIASGGTNTAQTAVLIFIGMTLLSLLPTIILTMTSFTRIIIVFAFLRQGLAIQGMPPNQILVGIAIFLTMFIMRPVADQVYNDSIDPLMKNQITFQDAAEKAKKPFTNFLLHNTRAEDIRFFYEITREPLPESPDEISLSLLIPSFLLSELRISFQMGFLVLIPFMVIDIVVSSILMAMGMMMLPPALISLPLKIMIFVIADGWNLLIGSLVQSFNQYG